MYDSHGYVINVIKHITFVKIDFFLVLKRMCVKFDFAVGVGKMKTKTLSVFFYSNAHSLRGLELSYLNSIKVLYTALLCWNLRAFENLQKNRPKLS